MGRVCPLYYIISFCLVKVLLLQGKIFLLFSIIGYYYFVWVGLKFFAVVL